MSESLCVNHNLKNLIIPPLFAHGKVRRQPADDNELRPGHCPVSSHLATVKFF